MPIRWPWPFRKRQPDAREKHLPDALPVTAPEPAGVEAVDKEIEGTPSPPSAFPPAELIARDDQPWDFSLSEELLQRLAPYAERPLLGDLGGLSIMASQPGSTQMAQMEQEFGGVQEFKPVSESEEFLAALPNLDGLLALDDTRSEELTTPDGLTDVLPPLQQHIHYRLGRQAAGAPGPESPGPRNLVLGAAHSTAPKTPAAGPTRAAAAAPPAPVSVQRQTAGPAPAPGKAPGSTQGADAGRSDSAAASHTEASSPASVSLPSPVDRGVAMRRPDISAPDSPALPTRPADPPSPAPALPVAPQPDDRIAPLDTPKAAPQPLTNQRPTQTENVPYENGQDLPGQASDSVYGESFPAQGSEAPAYPAVSLPAQLPDRLSAVPTWAEQDLFFSGAEEALPEIDEPGVPASPHEQTIVQRWSAPPLSVQPWLEPPITGSLGRERYEQDLFAGTTESAAPGEAVIGPVDQDNAGSARAGDFLTPLHTVPAPSLPGEAVPHLGEGAPTVPIQRTAQTSPTDSPASARPASSPRSASLQSSPRTGPQAHGMLSIQLWHVNQMLQNVPASLPGVEPGLTESDRALGEPTGRGGFEHDARQPAGMKVGFQRASAAKTRSGLPIQRFPINLPDMGTAAPRALPDMPLPNLRETAQNLQSGAAQIGAQTLGEQAMGQITSLAPGAETVQGQGMPNIQRLTDEIWREIQRRMRVERERTRGLS